MIKAYFYFLESGVILSSLSFLKFYSINAKLRGIIFTLLGGTLWGFSGTCGQYLLAVKGFDATWITIIRMLIGGIIILGFSVIHKKEQLKRILLNKQDLFHLFLFSIFGLVICQYTYMTAIFYLNAGTATVLQYLGPLFIMIYTCIKTLRYPSSKECISIFFAILGTFLLATQGNINTLVISPQGLFWGILSALGVMFYTILPINLMAKWGSIIVTGYGLLFGGIFLYLISGKGNFPFSIDLYTAFALAAIIIFGTVIAFILYLQGVNDIGAVKASMISCVEPVSAAIFSVVWLNSQFTYIDVIGFICIITTVFLLIKSK